MFLGPVNSTNGTFLPNASSSGTTQCTMFLDTDPVRFPLLFFLILVMVLAILGNTLIIYIVYSNKLMRTSTNIFIVNMAVCDLGISFVTPPEKISDIFLGQFVWPLGGKAGLALCKMFKFTDRLFICCSTFSLLLITFDRFCAVISPHKRHLLSKTIVIILISCAWLVSISFGEILLHLSGVFLVNEKLQCYPQWLDPNSLSAYLVSFAFICIVAPIVLVTGAYAAIFLKLKNQVHVLGNSFSDSLLYQNHLRQKKIVKMAFAIVCAFAISCLPFAVTYVTQACIIIFRTAYPCWFHTLFELSTYCLAIISVTNPAICFIFGRGFREELWKIYRRVFGWCCFGRRQVGPDNSDTTRFLGTVQTRSRETIHLQMEVFGDGGERGKEYAVQDNMTRTTTKLNQ